MICKFGTLFAAVGVAAVLAVGNTGIAVGSTGVGIAQLCPCDDMVITQQWRVDTLDATTILMTADATNSSCLAISPGPPAWGPEGSGAVLDSNCPASDPGMLSYQQWEVDTTAKQILWPRNSSMCLTVLPPTPAPKAQVGLWFCGAPGFEAAQSFEAVVDGKPPNYEIQLSGAVGQPRGGLCVSQAGTC
jgi:hypothetical protein